jgi:hypothetical protein
MGADLGRDMDLGREPAIWGSPPAVSGANRTKLLCDRYGFRFVNGR